MFNLLFVAFLVAEGTIVATSYVSDFVKKLHGKEVARYYAESNETHTHDNDSSIKNNSSASNINTNNGLTDDYNTNYRLTNMDIRDKQDLLAMAEDHNRYSNLSDYDRTYVDKALNDIRKW